LKNYSKTVTVQAIQAYSNSRGIDPLILELCSIQWKVTSFMHWPLNLKGKSFQWPLKWRLSGTQNQF